MALEMGIWGGGSGPGGRVREGQGKTPSSEGWNRLQGSAPLFFAGFTLRWCTSSGQCESYRQIIVESAAY
jgi:hypothetical protein